MERKAWLFLTALAAGAAIWCTHFIAMLGYRPDLPVGFEPVLTVVSLLAAMAGVAIGVNVAAWPSRLGGAILGGANLGMAMSVMH